MFSFTTLFSISSISNSLLITFLTQTQETYSYGAGIKIKCMSYHETSKWKPCTYIGQVKYNRSVKFTEVDQGHQFYLPDWKWGYLKEQISTQKYHCLTVVYTTRQTDINRHTVHCTEVIYSYSITNWNDLANFPMRKWEWKFIHRHQFISSHNFHFQNWV